MPKLTLLFTSDEHGHIGKAPRLQSLIKKEKQEDPNTLLLSSGDVFQGTAESDLQGGKPSLDVVDKAGYDLVELGNHDFDNGLPFVKDWLKQARYPVLAGNVKEESTGELLPGAKAYQVFELEGVKVGLIGVVAPETATISKAENVEGLQFEDPGPVVRQAKKELEEQGINVIGVVSHLGLPDDEKLAQEVDGLDFILGGHTHVALHQPKVVGDTLICQPGSFRDYLGRLEIEVDEAGEVTSYEHELIPSGRGEDEGGAVSETVENALQRLSKATSKITTESQNHLFHDHYRDNTLGAEMSEAMRAVTGAPFSLYNRKCERADIEAGDVSAGELYSSLPFPNEVVKARVSREQLTEAMRLSEEYADHRSLLHPYLSLLFDPSESGPKFSGIEIALGDDNAEFVELATTDFIASGGLGYFKDAEIISRHGFMRDVLEGGLDGKLPAGSPLREESNSADAVFAELKAD